MELCQHYSEVAPIVARRRLTLLVGGVLFFIDHNQSQPGEWEEEGAALPDYDYGPVLPSNLLRENAFVPSAEASPEEFQAFAECFGKWSLEVLPQFGLRLEDQGVTPLGQAVADLLYVELRSLYAPD